MPPRKGTARRKNESVETSCSQACDESPYTQELFSFYCNFEKDAQKRLDEIEQQSRKRYREYYDATYRALCSQVDQVSLSMKLVDFVTKMNQEIEEEKEKACTREAEEKENRRGNNDMRPSSRQQCRAASNRVELASDVLASNHTAGDKGNSMQQLFEEISSLQDPEIVSDLHKKLRLLIDESIDREKRKNKNMNMEL